jgi:glycosyltransferase involved in cell wall biosynthesis
MSRSPNGLRILMVTPRYLPEMGGIETHVHEVSRRLAAQGCDVDILTTDRTRTLPPSEAIAPGLRVRRLPAWPERRDYYIAPDIYREVMTARCDIVHVQGCHTFVPPLAMAAALRRQLPYVITFHSGGHSSRLRTLIRAPQWWALQPLVRRANRCCGVSRFEADYFSKAMTIPRERFAVIPNGGDMPVIATPVETDVLPPGSNKAGPLIVSIGRLERYKGHHRAIAAMPHVLQWIPGARLRIVGEGPYRPQLEALIRRLALEEKVSIGGIPPGERTRLASLVSTAALVVLLSEYEAHPVAVTEALALGRRVLVTDCTGFSEMVDGDAVTAVPPRASAPEIAAAVVARVERGPLPHAIPLPTWDDCTSRIVALYSEVLP